DQRGVGDLEYAVGGAFDEQRLAKVADRDRRHEVAAGRRDAVQIELPHLHERAQVPLAGRAAGDGPERLQVLARADLVGGPARRDLRFGEQRLEKAPQIVQPGALERRAGAVLEAARVARLAVRI